MGIRNSRTYTAEDKERATARALEVGAGKASAELGISAGTLSCWAFKSRQAAKVGGATPLATAPPVGKSPSAAPAASAPAPSAPAPSVPAPSVPAPSAPVAGPAPRPTSRARVAKVYTPSQIAQALERVAAIGVRPAAKELGISRNALRDWERKVAKAARGEGSAPTSGPDPKTIEEVRDRAILAEWEKQRGLGPSQIRNQLRRAGTKVSVQTVRRVMEGAGYRPPKVERRGHTGLYEAARPNQLWHMDFIHRYVHGQKVFLGVWLDDFSRFAVGWALDDAERADAVIASFEAAVARYGRPEAIMHDRGSAFLAWRGISRLTQILEEYGVDQLVADVPQKNGKSEVFNANLQKEFFDRVTFTDVGDLRRRTGPHLSWYNHQRTHHSLGGLLVPADRYFGRVEEVLARIESGGTVTDPLDLATRVLDLFRVVSNKGRPEVWLMGRRILETKE